MKCCGRADVLYNAIGQRRSLIICHAAKRTIKQRPFVLHLYKNVSIRGTCWIEDDSLLAHIAAGDFHHGPALSKGCRRCEGLEP
eukprot:1147949-Pelagomonas_calceolata.AAC.3